MLGFYTQKKILQIIHDKRSYHELLSKQISYSDISEILIYFLNEGFIQNTDTGFILTEDGKYMLSLSKEFKPIGKLEQYKIPHKLKVDEVYIPKYIEEVIKELEN